MDTNGELLQTKLTLEENDDILSNTQKDEKEQQNNNKPLKHIYKIEQKETKPELWYKDSKQLQEEDEKETINTIIDECLKVITKQKTALSKQEFKDNFRNTFKTNKARKIYNLALMCFKDIQNYKKLKQLQIDLFYEMQYIIKNRKKSPKFLEEEDHGKLILQMEMKSSLEDIQVMKKSV